MGRLIIYPSKKSEAVENMLKDYTGLTRKNVTLSRECMTCELDAISFRNQEAEDEYANSGMCQTCQDEIESHLANFRQTVVWSLTRVD